MANLVNLDNLFKFDYNFKFLKLKSSFDFRWELSKAYMELGHKFGDIDGKIDIFKKIYETFIENIVKKVQNCPRTQSRIHIELTPYNLALETPHLIFVAKVLHRSYGIEIQQVDAMSGPKEMVVGWPSDAPICSNNLEYLQKARKDGFLIDYNLKLKREGFKDNDFPVHKLLLASRVPYFDRIFRGGFKESVEHVVTVDGVEASSFEFFVDYVYTGKLQLKGQPAASLCSLVRLADFYELIYFKEKCFEEMCKTVNVDNLLEMLDCTAQYQLDTGALLENVVDEAQPENLEKFISIARKREIEGFETACIERTLKTYEKGLPEISNLTLLLQVLFDCKQPNAFKTLLDDNICVAMKDYFIPADRLWGYLQFAYEHAMVSMQTLCATKVLRKLKAKDLANEALSLDQFKDLLVIAKKHELTDILNECENKLLDFVEENPERTAVLANRFNLLRLQEACKKN